MLGGQSRRLGIGKSHGCVENCPKCTAFGIYMVRIIHRSAHELEWELWKIELALIKYATVLAAFGTIGGMIFGFEISSMSAWIGSEQYLEYFNHPSSSEQGGITASMSAGYFIGSLLSGWLADRIGRRLAIQIASVDWIVGAVLQCSAQNVAHLVVGRIVSGLAIGITSSQCIVYLAELAPSRSRGRIVGIQQWSIDWGKNNIPNAYVQKI